VIGAAILLFHLAASLSLTIKIKMILADGTDIYQRFLNKCSGGMPLAQIGCGHRIRCSIQIVRRSQLIMKHINRIVASLIFLLATGMNVFAQSNEQNITVTVKPSQTVEQRVSDSIKERELREAAEAKLAAEKSARIASKSPRALLSSAQTVFVESNTSYFESVQLQNALRKRSEFEAWEMAIIDGWDKRQVADIIVEVDRPIFTFTFTYKITDRSNGILLTSGKITAMDGNAAAPLLAERIVEDMKKARGETKKK